MAMLILPEVFRRTSGERSLPADGTAPVDKPFWPEAIRRVRASQPRFLFMAEVYWGLEWELIEEGFDHCYDKPLYDRLLSREAAAVRQHLRAAPAYQNRLVRFLENHDELRAAHEFPVPVHEAAAVLTYLIPSLRFFHEGQLEGRRVKVPIQMGRRREEPVDPLLQEFYRKLLACLKRPEVRQGRWQLLGVRPAWEGNPTWERCLAFAWEGKAGQLLLITVNYGPTQGQAYVALPFLDLGGSPVILQDLMSEARYERRGDDLLDRGLYLDLPAWGLHVISCHTNLPSNK